MSKNEINKNEKNGIWKGDNAGLDAIHIWVRKRLLKPKFCQNCKKNKSYDLANKGIYNRDFKNWEWLCRKCHMIKDGRINKLKERNKLRYSKIKKKCLICDKVFLIIKSKLKQRFCSYKCYQVFLETIYLKCKICGNNFKSIKSRPKIYCSRKCYFQNR